MPKIYILGSVGSGKTTFAHRLSEELKIPYFELDNVIWKPSEAGPDIRREESEIHQIFEEIICQENWIIENVGRSHFDRGFDCADTILYLKMSKYTLYRRVLKRWIKQNMGREPAPYQPNLKMLKLMFQWIDKEQKHSKLEKLSLYRDKTIILTEKTLKDYHYQTEESAK